MKSDTQNKFEEVLEKHCKKCKLFVSTGKMCRNTTFNTHYKWPYDIRDLIATGSECQSWV